MPVETSGRSANSKPQTPNPAPQTPKPQTPKPTPQPQTPNPTPQTPNPKPQTPNPKPQTPNPKPQTLKTLNNRRERAHGRSLSRSWPIRFASTFGKPSLLHRHRKNGMWNFLQLHICTTKHSAGQTENGPPRAHNLTGQRMPCCPLTNVAFEISTFDLARPPHPWFRVQGAGCRVQVQDAGFRVQDAGFRVES